LVERGGGEKNKENQPLFFSLSFPPKNILFIFWPIENLALVFWQLVVD
jgi:hypothetical protein